MNEDEKIRKKIRAFAMHPKSVLPTDIEHVVAHIALYEKVETSGDRHLKLYNIAGEQFSICSLSGRANAVIKSCYVRDFLNVMMKLGWYE